MRHHHERIGGAGYPDGLLGHTIPFGARVVAVADTWDALASERPYRPGMAAERAAAIMREGRGAQWSPDLVDALPIALGLAAQLELAPEPRAALDARPAAFAAPNPQ